MTRQKHGAVLSLEIFAAVEKCGADNKTNPKVSLLVGLFFMLLLSSADFSNLTFNKRLSGTQSKIDPDQYRRSRSWSWSKLFAKVISRRLKSQRINHTCSLQIGLNDLNLLVG